MNAKQLVGGNVYGFGVILGITANTPVDLNNDLSKFAQVSGVTGVIIPVLRIMEM